MRVSSDEVRWHDIECGHYTADLSFWEKLAQEEAGPVLDVGAGTGRVALHLAEAGHSVMALDIAPELLEELLTRARERDITVDAVIADATEFELPHQFGLVIVPMQTIQLLPSPAARLSFLEVAKRHLSSGGLLAIAISEYLEEFSGDPDAYPDPDQAEHEPLIYQSQPTAIVAVDQGFCIERQRRILDADGTVTKHETNLIVLAPLSESELINEGESVGLSFAVSIDISPTAEHVGSTVVMFRG